MFHSLLLVWKVKKSQYSQFLNERFSQYFTYETRQATGNCFALKNTPKSELSRKSFVHSSATLWNSLPSHLRSIVALETFKRELRTWVTENVEI